MKNKTFIIIGAPASDMALGDDTCHTWHFQHTIKKELHSVDGKIICTAFYFKRDYLVARPDTQTPTIYDVKSLYILRLVEGDVEIASYGSTIREAYVRAYRALRNNRMTQALDQTLVQQAQESSAYIQARFAAAKAGAQ